MMKINTFHGLVQTKWIRQGIYTTVYRMKEAIQGGRVVYFNDSTVARMKGVGFDGVRSPGRSDLVFRQKGVLSMEPGPPSHLDIELGKEYFIVLYMVTSRKGFGYYYQLMDKEHFYYKLL